MKKIFKKIKTLRFEMTLLIIIVIRLPYEQWRQRGLALAILCVSTAYILGRVMRRADEKLKPVLLLFVAFLLASYTVNGVFLFSFSSEQMIYYKSLLFPVFYLLIILIGSAESFVQIKFFSYFIPVLSVLGIILHPSFGFFFLPVIFILLKYKAVTEKEKLANRLFYTTLTAGAVSYFIYGVLRFDGGVKHFGVFPFGYIQEFFSWNLFLKANAAVLPLIAIFTYIWVSAIKKSDKNETKHIFIFCLFEPMLLVVINFFFFYQGGDSWQYNVFMIVFSQFSLIFCFLALGDNTVTYEARKIYSYLEQHWIFLLTILIILMKSSYFLN